MKKRAMFIMGTALITGALALLGGNPDTSLADIYRWEDDRGVIHFTDTPSNIPPKFRGRQKIILQGPPEAGHPSLSTMGGPSPARSAPPAYTPAPAAPADPSRPPEDVSREAEQLRARIAAKEQFIKGIDLKRSHGLNPMGNRFVSPEDLELYRKYSDELPKDRERLKEIETDAR